MYKKRDLNNTDVAPSIVVDHPTLMLSGKQLRIGTAFEIRPGTLACITGESGRGKTSLLKAMLGLVEIADGVVAINGHQVSADNIASIRSQAAYVPQEIQPRVEWVRELVSLPYSLKVNSHLKFNEDEMYKLWYDLGLEKSLYSQRVSELSGGQRARIVLASALLTHKSIVLIDEPTAALDMENSEKTAARLNKWCTDENCVMAVVSHDDRMIKYGDVINI